LGWRQFFNACTVSAGWSMSAACWIRLGAEIGWLGWLVQPQHQPDNSALPNGLNVGSSAGIPNGAQRPAHKGM